MRRQSSWPVAVLGPILGIVFALGLAPVDPTIVWACAPPTAPAAHIVASTNGTLAAAPGEICQCGDGCLAVAAAKATNRVATLARFLPSGDSGIAQSDGHLARVLPLTTLGDLPKLVVNQFYLLNLPWQPARLSGADRCAPRPPPA